MGVAPTSRTSRRTHISPTAQPPRARKWGQIAGRARSRTFCVNTSHTFVPGRLRAASFWAHAQTLLYNFRAWCSHPRHGVPSFCDLCASRDASHPLPPIVPRALRAAGVLRLRAAPYGQIRRPRAHSRTSSVLQYCMSPAPSPRRTATFRPRSRGALPAAIYPSPPVLASGQGRPVGHSQGACIQARTAYDILRLGSHCPTFMQRARPRRAPRLSTYVTVDLAASSHGAFRSASAVVRPHTP